MSFTKVGLTGVFVIVSVSFGLVGGFTANGEYSAEGPPCSGATSGPCAQEAPASEACDKYSMGGVGDDCHGEVIGVPFASDLVPGQPSNNLRYSYNYRVCVFRYDCVEGSIWDCEKGPKTGTSYVREVYSGGDCRIPVVAPPVVAMP